MSSLRLKSITKNYGDYVALRDVDLSVDDGEFVALVGPSGCGKSTLLRMISGLDTPSEGFIEVGGKDVTGLPPQQRNLAMVFQSYALFPHLTVDENIRFGMNLRKVAKEEKERRASNAASILNLSEYLDRLPQALSGGQRQRVAMARAIVREPSLYLMDEPLSNLDAQLRVQMRAEIKGLHQRLGSTFIYVTHDQVEAMTLADKLVLMRDGRVVQEGHPLDIYDDPSTLFAAQFLGTPAINVLESEVEGGEIRLGDYTMSSRNPELTGRFHLAVRPNHTKLAGDGLPAAVELVENLGSEAILHLSTPLGSVRILQQGRADAKVGDNTHVAFNPDALYLFDRGMGQRVGSQPSANGKSMETSGRTSSASF